MEKYEKVVQACNELIEEMKEKPKDELAKRREKIQEGMRIVLSDCLARDDLLASDIVQLQLEYLNSEGCLLKVKCPDCEWSKFSEEAVGMTPCYSCNSTGYIFEPLIEEKDADTAE